MIRDTGIYKVKILKEDVKNWNDDEFVFFVKTNDIESAKETQSLKEEKDQLQQSHDTYVKEIWNQHIEIQNLKSQLSSMIQDKEQIITDKKLKELYDLGIYPLVYKVGRK